MDSISFYIDDELEEVSGTVSRTDDRQMPEVSYEHVAIQSKAPPALPSSIPPLLPAELIHNAPFFPNITSFAAEYNNPALEPTKPANTNLREPSDSIPRLRPSSDSRTVALERSSENTLVATEGFKPLVTDITLKKPDLVQEITTQIATADPNPLVTNTTPRPSYIAQETTHDATGEPKPLATYIRPTRSYTAKETKLRTERNIKFFKDSILTEDKLHMLGTRWLNRGLLKNVLSYCKPFTITLRKTHFSSSAGVKTPFLRSDKSLVTLDHRNLFDYLHENDHWEAFAESFASTWPRTFGWLIDEDGTDLRYLWPRESLITDDEAAIICRKSVPRGQGPQELLASLFRGFALTTQPQDNMLW
ncbi:hypothetical protein PFICI_07783 [Pestalotiopsis fici W106-1]|uniref:Uncharacterized protein n=1 Tax=Pestalotiopsis fici (strain W106-1 / CGMCC3.15140) TaxID=1229662 RepID=W3X2M2_PESFW|nr:uncharacterized protein PFICI_07783 [Pestalotiopsis fici W106-1]ETS80254.1 hypothetical protein PFICI_07783 [Pestalotiopsis fici W106-1]